LALPAGRSRTCTSEAWLIMLSVAAAASLGPISANPLHASRSLPSAPCAVRPRARSQTRRPARPAWRSPAGCRPRSRGQRASRAGAAHMHHTRCRAAVCGQRGGAMRLLLARTRAGRLLEARWRLRPAAERRAATALVADTARAATRAEHAGQDNNTAIQQTCHTLDSPHSQGPGGGAHGHILPQRAQLQHAAIQRARGDAGLHHLPPAPIRMPG